jgi:hypothetical protein
VSGDEGFLSRWSRRKAEQQRGGGSEADAPPPTLAPAVAPPVPAEAQVVGADEASVGPKPDSAASAPTTGEPPAPPLPTMDDVAALTGDSDYARFVAPGVDETVKRAAMKKLFSDPHFNVMDGLDTYIDDYNKPDPIPPAMLRRLNQSTLLRLFDDDTRRAGEPDDNRPPEPMHEPAQVPSRVAAAPEPIADDHDADLQLQPDDDAGRSGPEPGPRA